MSLTQAIDCSAVLTASQAQGIKSAGYDAVCRYLGSWAKSLTVAEPPIIFAAGLDLISIWEGNPTYAGYFTPTHAQQDVSRAELDAEAKGQPPGTAIYYTADYDAQDADMSAIVAYFGEVIACSQTYRPGAYGSYHVMYALHAEYGDKLLYWQTSAWSGGMQFTGGTMYQHTYNQALDGVQFDVSDVLAAPGAWKGLNPVATYPKVQAEVNGKPVLAVSVAGVTYLDWTVARDSGCNLTHVAPGDVEIDGQKPPQVSDSVTTYVKWAAIPTIDPRPNKVNGVWQFKTIPKEVTVPTTPAPAPTGPSAADIAQALSLMEQAAQLNAQAQQLLKG
jgi:hypothetical protein